MVDTSASPSAGRVGGTTRPSRILVHDYSGHPFQVQLSRELAARGHHVLHLHCPSYLTGKGALERRPDDPATFEVEAVTLGETFQKYSAIKRWQQERRYGRLCADRIERFRPDVVLSSNTPLFAQQILLERARQINARFVFWQQDVYSVAMSNFARGKLPVIGAAVGALFVRMERSMLAKSDHVVTISEDFLGILAEWGIRDEAITVVPNWAPLDEIGDVSSTGWAETHGLTGRTVFLYSGTLGLKHNPGLLLELARSVGDRDDVRVVVISEGKGADWLAERAASAPALVLLPFQPYEVLAEVLRSADVLIAILEPEAGVFSVPSKVLSYHCVERPILAAVPAENLAARIIEQNDSGVVVDPTDEQSFVRSAWQLAEDPDRRREMGRRARAYAEATFDIGAIADQFERVVAAPDAIPARPRPQILTQHTLRNT